MGRTSKFSFPIPGRKHSTTKEVPPPSNGLKSPGLSLSKAQRILGTGDLNVDSPTKEEDEHWRFPYPGSRTRRMSVTISESTNDNESSDGASFAERWENESGVFSKGTRRLHGKASSTLLGQQDHDDGPNSSGRRRLRHEDSNSTLRSHYDRQKSPLSISQQTSASSTRDAALRKGFPPVIQRSPLLQVESQVSPYQTSHSAEPQRPKTKGSGQDMDHLAREKESRKKPAKLDLSLLFPRPRLHRGKSSDSASTAPSISSVSTSGSHAPSEKTRPRKLSKTKSKDPIQPLQSPALSARMSESQDPRLYRQAVGNLRGLHDHYDQGILSPRMDRIPETRVPLSRMAAPAMKEEVLMFRHDSTATRLTSHTNNSKPIESEPFSWKNVRSTMVEQDSESVKLQPKAALKPASITSRTSRASRQTTASCISNSDLRLKSVLSLSSDSEPEAWEQAGGRAPSMTSTKNSRGTSKSVSRGTRESQSRSRQIPPAEGLSPRHHNSKHPTKPPPIHEEPHLVVPGKYTAPLSPPWTEPRDSSSSSSTLHKRQPSSREKRTPKKSSSLASGRSSQQQPTPPLSPSSVDFRAAEVSERTSRFMAVTRQEEALLEALRQKRARMREKIIEQHESEKTPPREAEVERQMMEYPDERRRILKYLDKPQQQRHREEEPEPDLSDIVGFESEEDTTPRGSWAPPPKAKVRAESRSTSSNGPQSPESAVRLSAVGAVGGFKVHSQRKKRHNEGVRFAEQPKSGYEKDFLMDESETEGMYYY